MSDKKAINKWIPIAVFYVIAIVIRAVTLRMGRSDVADIGYQVYPYRFVVCHLVCTMEQVDS